MKKIVVLFNIFLLFSLSLNASNDDGNKVYISGSKGLYNDALKNFRSKNYEKSYTQFNALFLTNMEDVLINFYLGRSAYELEKYEFALSAYDRILIAEPNNTRARLEMAQTYFKMKLYVQSLSEFNEVLKNKKLPLKVKKIVNAKVEYIKSIQKKSFIKATAIAGILYDSNINSTPATGSFNIYNPTVDSTVLVTNNDKEESTSIYQVVGQLNHTYKYSDNFILNSSVTALLMKYNDHKEKDIHALSLSTAPTYLFKNYKIALSVLFDKVNLGHESYQNNIYFNPTYTRVLNDKTLYSSGLKLGRVTFVKEKDRDVNLLEWQNSLKYLTNKFGLFTIGLNLGKEYELREQRTDVEHGYFNSYINNSYEIGEDYLLQTAISHKQLNYDDTDINFQSKRKDKKSDFSISLIKPINKQVITNIGANYTKKDSNHVASEYDKYTIKANLIWDINLK